MVNLNFYAQGRDKIEMAWRHKSRDEKILLRIIAGLCVCLVAFITTVAILDISYLDEIKELEDHISDLNAQIDELTADGQALLVINNKHEIKDLKAEIERLKEPRSTESITDLTEETEVTESNVPTIPPEPSSTTTTTVPTTSLAPSIETTSEKTETSSLELIPSHISSSSKGVEIEAAVVGSLLLQALQSIMNIDDKNSSNTIIEEFNNGRTKATVVLMANLEHQSPTKFPQNNHRTIETMEKDYMSLDIQSPEDLQHQYASLESTTEVPLTTSSTSWWPFGYQNTPTDYTTINPNTIQVDIDKSKRRPIRHRKRKTNKQKSKENEQ